MLQVEKSGRAQIRSKNKVRIFKELATYGELSRTQLEKRLKLSAPSITRIVEGLIADGLVRETRTEDVAIGRRPVLLQVCAESFYTIGIHISRTTMKLCVVDMSLRVCYESHKQIKEIKTGEELEAIFEKLLLETKETLKLDHKQILGVGVASRGAVDGRCGEILRFQESITHIHIGDIIEKTIGCFWYLENNVSAEVECEYLATYKELPDHMICVFVDEGVGCCIVSNGSILGGANCLGGKIAHLVVEAGGRLCDCGKRGHLEAYLAAPKVEEIYLEKSAQSRSYEEICVLANHEDVVAREVMEDAVAKLGIGLLQMIGVLNPRSIILCGTMFDLCKWSTPQLQKYVEEQVFLPKLAQIEWGIKERKEFDVERLVAKGIVYKALEQKI